MTVLLTGALVFITIYVVKCVTFKQECSGHLRRAADANTVETAQKELIVATKYLEDNNITSGYTSVFWQTPDEDIAFWYNNLKASENELSKVDSTTSSLEKTNILMKLRETLMDHGKEGDHVTYPKGLATYPQNGLYGTLILLSILIILLAFAALINYFD